MPFAIKQTDIFKSSDANEQFITSIPPFINLNVFVNNLPALVIGNLLTPHVAILIPHTPLIAPNPVIDDVFNVKIGPAKTPIATNLHFVGFLPGTPVCAPDLLTPFPPLPSNVFIGVG